MRFPLIFAFIVLAQNNNGTESCNVVKKELQHYQEGTFVKSSDIFTLFSTLFLSRGTGGTGQDVKILSRLVLWQDFELFPLSLCPSGQENSVLLKTKLHCNLYFNVYRHKRHDFHSKQAIATDLK